MKRRDMILGLGAAGLLGACGNESNAPVVPTDRNRRFRWNMVTTWPKNFPGLGTAAEDIAARIGEMSGGRLTVTVYGAGERVPALEVFDAVSGGAAQMGHGAAYYWKGKSPAAVFFTTVPFGLTSWEMSAWLHYGGGMELWRELYADFGLVPFEAGNTGTQMGGWFRQPIDGLAQLNRLKMRIPGLGGEAMQRLGVTTVNIPGGELFTSMQTGVIDAVEWVGPYNDLAFGLHRVAKHYYYPGWHEPGPALELTVNADAWAGLPADLQAVVAAACATSGARMTAELAARNERALRTLVDDHGVQLHQFPDDVLAALRKASAEVLDELVAGDAFARKVYESYRQFAKNVAANTRLGELAYLRAREKTY
jgi:TRAP-type mannitol/chloroaromatic compound transport system substrate-binding protein